MSIDTNADLSGLVAVAPKEVETYELDPDKINDFEDLKAVVLALNVRFHRAYPDLEKVKQYCRVAKD